MHRLMQLAIGVSAMAFAAPGSAAVTTLDFSGNICGVAGNQACSNGSQIGQNYGDGTGVDVSYRSVTSSGQTFEMFLKHWNTGYGDLTSNVWGGANSSFGSEITFTALAGFELRILSFDAACYLNRTSCQNFPFSINEIGGGSVAGGNITPPSGGRSSLTFDQAYSSTGYVLRWGPDGYDGGLDNIRFDVRAIATGAVPEPTTWALLILGFGTIGVAMRRRGARQRDAQARLILA